MALRWTCRPVVGNNAGAAPARRGLTSDGSWGGNGYGARGPSARLRSVTGPSPWRAIARRERNHGAPRPPSSRTGAVPTASGGTCTSPMPRSESPRRATCFGWRGQRVTQLARVYVRGGVLIARVPDLDSRLRRTKAAITSGAPAIYHAAFRTAAASPGERARGLTVGPQCFDQRHCPFTDRCWPGSPAAMAT